MRASQQDQGRGSGSQSSASEPSGGSIPSNSSESSEQPSSSNSTNSPKESFRQGQGSSAKTVIKGQNQQRPPQEQQRGVGNPSQLVPFVPRRVVNRGEYQVVGYHHPQCLNPSHLAASSGARGQRVLRERGHQNRGGVPVSGAGVISSTTRNQVIFVGDCYCYTSTSTVTNSSVVLLAGSGQGRMDHRNPYGFPSQPSSQGFDTVNGFPSGQQNGGAAGGYQQHQHQQMSQPQGYNGQMPMVGRGAGSYGIVVSQNHAINHNFYFTSPGSYDVNVQAPAVAAPNMNRMTGFGQGGQGWQGQVPYGYEDARGYRTFQTAGSAFVPIATTGPRTSDSSMTVNRSVDQTPPSSARTRPCSVNGTGGHSPFPGTTGPNYFQPTSGSQPQHQFGLPGAGSFGVHRARAGAGSGSFQNSSASLSQGSLDNYDDLFDEDQENSLDRSGARINKAAFTFPTHFRDRFQ